MTYGCLQLGRDTHAYVAVSHSAELVRGYFLVAKCRPPHPVLRTTFSPRGEGTYPPFWKQACTRRFFLTTTPTSVIP
jgi:hypothetical protein